MTRLFACLALAATIAAAGCGGDAETTTAPAPTATVAPATPGSPPTLAPAPIANDPAAPPAPIVIASGITPKGDPFELVAHGLSKSGLCLSLMFPTRGASEGGGGCGEQVFVRFRGPIASWGSGHAPDPLVDGWVSSDVRRVEISYEEDGAPQAFEAVTEQIPLRILRAGGSDKPRGIFIAFLPHGVDTSKVTATAYGAGGVRLGAATWPELEAAR